MSLVAFLETSRHKMLAGQKLPKKKVELYHTGDAAGHRYMSHRKWPAGNQELHQSTARRNRSLQTWDKELHIRSLTEKVEGYFLVNDVIEKAEDR